MTHRQFLPASGAGIAAFMATLAAEPDAYMAEVARHYVDCPGCHHCVPVPLARCETCGVYGEHSWLCGWERVPA